METTIKNNTNYTEIITFLQEENKFQSIEIQNLKGQVELLLAQIYAKSSEKRKPSLEDTDQSNFFDLVDNSLSPDESLENSEPEAIDVPAHSRKKAGRKPLPEHLDRIEVIHDIPSEDKVCGCGSEMTRFGEEVSEQLKYTPARLEVIRNIRPKYACKTCEGVETKGSTVKIAPAPLQLLPKTITTPELLAQIAVAKFVDANPFYRQEKQFGRLGYALSRTNMTNWIIQISKALEKLDGLLRQSVLSGPLINMDETPFQVLKEIGRLATTKSYMWVMRGGAPDKPTVYFWYSPTRASAVAKNLLTSYHGIVQTDGYAGYNFVHAPETRKIEHAECWAHARRKFNDILKAGGKKRKTRTGHADQALAFVGNLYKIEKKAKSEELSESQIVALRQEQSKPILNEFYKWLRYVEHRTPPKGLLGKAVGYTLERWKQLVLYLDHGFIPMDNNLAENAIRPFVIGRKNWLFNDTPAGATASARLYSLIETAKANDVEPSEYLKMLFERLPHVKNDHQLEQLLPQHYHANTTEAENKVGLN